MFKSISMELMECLIKDTQKEKEKRTLLYIVGKAVLIATGANLLDTKYELYGFSDDLRDTIY